MLMQDPPVEFLNSQQHPLVGILKIWIGSQQKKSKMRKGLKAGVSESLQKKQAMYSVLNGEPKIGNMTLNPTKHTPILKYVFRRKITPIFEVIGPLTYRMVLDFQAH